MRLLTCVTAIALMAMFAPSAAEAADSRRPLDLPVSGSGNNEDDEDTPETILFYGSEFEGDGFFFCFPAFDF